MNNRAVRIITAGIIGCMLTMTSLNIYADDDRADKHSKSAEKVYLSINGGGYAATGQLDDVGYISEIYDATNGLPTSDANYIMAASDGYIWIGGYSGIIRYDGSVFERLDSSEGLTSGRCIYEDSLNRIWIGTNDNGVVAIDG